ncbi:MAG TPA: YfiR family protein [Desulfuromonadaceae bacterium]
MGKAAILICCIVLTAFSAVLPLPAFTAELGEYEIKAGMLFNFASYVEWPEESRDKTHTLGVCIAGGNSLSNRPFERLHGKVSQGRKLVVRHVEAPRDLNGCNVLFIGRSEQDQATAYIREAVKRSILTVSDIDRFAPDGGIIGFFEQDGKIRFEINKEAAHLSRLRISSKLLKLAVIVGMRR